MIEEHLNKPLHWFICILHINELLLRHFFTEIEGKSKGPNVFGGVIGKDLKSCETLKIEKFTPILVVSSGI